MTATPPGPPPAGPPTAGPPPPPGPPPGPPPAGAAPRPPLSDRRAPSVFGALYQLFLRTQVSRTKVLSLVALSVVGILVGWALGSGRVRNHLAAGTNFANGFGLSLFIPLVCLVFASSMFGDLTDDGTLVYVWLRPIGRLKLVLAAALAALTVSFPIAVPPLVIATSLTGGGPEVVRATLIASTVATIAYVGMFVALGLRVKRPLVWGLLYIFIWEGFIARGSYTASEFAIRAYGSSILFNATNIKLPIANFPSDWSIAVPLVVSALSLAYAVFRLKHQDVA